MTDKLVELIAKYFEKLNPNSNHIIATQLAGYLRNNGVTVQLGRDSLLFRLHRKGFRAQAMTNGDRIRAMSDEELGKLLYGLGYDAYEYALNPHRKPVADTESGWINWLKQPLEIEHE